MELLEGKVRRVRHATEVSGGGRSSTRTHHVAVFDVGGVLITFRSPDPVPIERGDEVRVLGHEDVGRTFDAVAYHNLTRDVVEDALPRGGCVGLLLVLGFVVVLAGALILLLACFDLGVIPWLRATVPAPLLLVPPPLLALAIIRDRRHDARIQEVLAPLYDP
jgi:hypothetical protein